MHDGRELVSVGTPLSGVSVAIVDGNNQPVAEGSTGAIRLRSPSLMQGYFRDDAASAEVLQDGWLHTGDIGFVKGGELFVSGRKKELIIKRGRNYAPEELESVAVQAAKGQVLRAAAFGAPDDREGTERVVLVLETRAMTQQQQDKLTREVAGMLTSASGIGPDVTLVVPPHTIERTTSGKLRRAPLRTRFLDGSLPAHGNIAPAPVTEEA
jgi:acyl-CoA synthetase (AMP-forming)/AMP-acid ligase II